MRSRSAPERLVVGVPTLLQATLVWVAHAQGHFAAHGVAVEMRRFTSGRDALAYDTPVILQTAAGRAGGAHRAARFDPRSAPRRAEGPGHRSRRGSPRQARRGPPAHERRVLRIDVALVRRGAARWRRQLTKLLSNAAQHAPSAPVRVGLRRQGGRTLLVVEDGGPGVPGAARERIVARYERAEPGRASSGLGLGLYTARQIVDAHGGTISVAEIPLAGAAFTIELPAVDP